MSFVLITPTLQAERYWLNWSASYLSQKLKSDEVIIIDSKSTDNTVKLAHQTGFSVISIDKSEFNHGGTRNLAVKLSQVDADILVFMTQDAILANENSLQKLIEPFNDPDVAAVYGRQLPHKGATPLAIHARLFNYPNKSAVKTRDDISSLGIKAAFMSNSFAAYRKSVFEKLGGFPNNTILAEDMYLTAKIILAGYKVVYAAEAQAYHSHNYSLVQEFKRYFDTGVFQQKEPWIQEKFGKANNEGKRFVLSELHYLVKNAPLWIPKAMLSTLFKFLGFKFGLNWNRLPNRLAKHLSMHRDYWK